MCVDYFGFLADKESKQWFVKRSGKFFSFDCVKSEQFVSLLYQDRVTVVPQSYTDKSGLELISLNFSEEEKKQAQDFIRKFEENGPAGYQFSEAMYEFGETPKPKTTTNENAAWTTPPMVYPNFIHMMSMSMDLDKVFNAMLFVVGTTVYTPLMLFPWETDGSRVKKIIERLWPVMPQEPSPGSKKRQRK